MKIKILGLIIFSMACGSLHAQEFLDQQDFVIGIEHIQPSLSTTDLATSLRSSFDLPDGSFLHLQVIKRQEVDMLAVITKENSKKPRTVDIGDPIPKKKKKAIQLTGTAEALDFDEQNPGMYSPNPFYQRYRISPYRVPTLTNYPIDRSKDRPRIYY